MERFEEIIPYKEIWVKDLEEKGKEFFLQLCLFHYPILTWNRHHYNSIHLHGHCHHNLKDDKYYSRRVIDVGCNGHNYEPLSYIDIKYILKNRIIDKVDHH
mgnify:CR=1 FL=1